MIFDILALLFIGLGFYQGYKNGIIYSLFSMAGWFLGLFGALKFSYLMVNFLQDVAGLSPKALAIVSFILVLALVVGLMKLVAWGLEQILKSMSLNLFNQIFGGILHSLIGLYVLCVLVWFVNKIDVFPASQKSNSHSYAYIDDLAPKVMEVSGKVVPMFRDTFEQFEKLFRSSPAG
ncbi:MAG: CvpA family protein [Chitinophagales bacterium]|nr:CvpA family protein [Chitinophagales bacterium]